MLGQIDLSCPVGGALLWRPQVRSQCPTTSPPEPRTSSSWLPSSGPGRTLGFGREVTSPGDKGQVTRVNQDAPGSPCGFPETPRSCRHREVLRTPRRLRWDADSRACVSWPTAQSPAVSLAVKDTEGLSASLTSWQLITRENQQNRKTDGGDGRTSCH